jgi:sugar phosphate isomerase/epimerase
MYSYALSLSYRCAEDPEWFEAVSRSKVRKFEFGADGSVPPEAYAAAVDNILRTASTVGVEAASVHIPFGAAPWVPSRESERAEALEAIRGLMRAWAPLRPPCYTLHGCTEADKDVPHSEQMRALRVFLSEILPDVEAAGTSFNIEYLPRTCLCNVPEELEEIVDGFPADRVGICLDVNHASPRTEIMPDLIRRLGPRINTFHLSDCDGIDECHWYPGHGVINWPRCMREIKALKRDTLLVLEVFKLPFPEWQSAWHHNSHASDLAAMEMNVFFLENAEEILYRINSQKIP